MSDPNNSSRREPDSPEMESPMDTAKDGTSDLEARSLDKAVLDEKRGITAADRELQPGELSLEDATAGGQGRHLGLFSTTMLITSRIIGTGIFSTPASIVSGVGSVGAALCLWALGALLAFAGLCVYLEFATMFPRSGGEKVYLEAVYRKPKMLATVFFSTQAILLGFTAQGCIIFATNLVAAADRKATEWEQRGIAIAVITFVTIVHGLLPNTGVRLMNALSVIKIILLLVVCVTGWVVLGGGTRIQDPKAAFRDAFAGSSQAPYNYATALFKVINSYAGWSNAVLVLGEIKDPIRTIKRAGPLGLGICVVLYMFANVAYFSVGTVQELSHSGTTIGSYFFGKVFGHTAQRVFAVFVALSALGNVLTVTFAQSRVNQELAKEGALPWPELFASNWPTQRSPMMGLIVHFIPSFIVIVAPPFGTAYNLILDIEGYPGQVIALLVVVGLFYLRVKAPNVPRAFKVYWPVASFYLAAAVFLLIIPFLRPPGGKGDTTLPYWLAPVIGIAVLASGVVGWFVWMVVLPRALKFEYEKQRNVLPDGTVFFKYVPRYFRDGKAGKMPALAEKTSAENKASEPEA
ncbi:unnamed protein product [Tilletia controversa]|uniref:High affinity methionine permease n=3 Tax=Tilletia TaxID=13289 RepID=A0A8X7N179_9BASI|nr:hypothetical protein CF336_g3039 [Tilletia laevis]KAE8205358.1 hypothetical protein CF328_g537 [Tilletia controversa]KAE8262317.1 hypothetical protein A4X03_0g2551 [Tilletia caries]KAE8205350.1 hypothetical protein CF335_g2330 [Tilletia laevis]KAE8255171.1 hypothetical protein A4X06_0g550 [Tilletia controversa]